MFLSAAILDEQRVELLRITSAAERHTLRDGYKNLFADREESPSDTAFRTTKPPIRYGHAGVHRCARDRDSRRQNANRSKRHHWVLRRILVLSAASTGVPHCHPK
ncbi:hypothetical protein GOSPT_128_00030 [Gordonia sputi NBRC 100414]|uniref:Uncharacterized protein n=1 Tax=Gordonia sputi NBRC 100414 TaxID=1089453 RepID=H5U6I0_9ACTN|nr:hypothetical protein GOSPT_128_00030 [Gordonia sputi NBRC 100414]